MVSKREETKYTRSELLEDAQALFHVQPEIVIGALYDNPGQELSVVEVKKAIRIFLNRKVK